MKRASHILLSLAFLAWSLPAFATNFGYTTAATGTEQAGYCFEDSDAAYQYTAVSGDVLNDIWLYADNVFGGTNAIEVGLYDITGLTGPTATLVTSANITYTTSGKSWQSVAMNQSLTAGHTYVVAVCATSSVRLPTDTPGTGATVNDGVSTLQSTFGGYGTTAIVSVYGTVTNSNAPTVTAINGGSALTTDQTSITITGTNLGSITAVTLENGTGSLSSSQTFTLGTSTSLTWDSVTLGTVPLTSASNTVELTVTNAAGTSAPVTFTLNPPSGYSTVEIGTADTSATSLCGSRVVTSTPPPTSEFVVPATTRNGGTLTVTSACGFTVSGGTSTDYIDGLKLWDATSGSQAWYGPMNVTLNGGSIATTPPRGGLLVNPGTLME